MLPMVLGGNFTKYVREGNQGKKKIKRVYRINNYIGYIKNVLPKMFHLLPSSTSINFILPY